FARELRVSARLNHPNVLTFLGYVREETEKEIKYCLVTEMMVGGSLRDRLNSTREPTTTELLAMSLGVAKGVCYLHSKDIVHADLKAANVLISRSGDLVLADFGLARMAQSPWSKGYYTTEVTRASMRWVPFEYFHLEDSEKFRPDQKTDIWAFGMTLLVRLAMIWSREMH
ncbi:kinase-like protein, partial [Schizopora paradoxa]